MGYVCVIGGTNVDIICTPNEQLHLRDSNPSKITITAGGVGRNIAENLARLSQQVKLISVIGNDVNAQIIRDNAILVGMDITHCMQVDMPTSMYVAINDSNNDMLVGANSMQSAQMLSQEFLSSKLELLNGASCVVVDTNMYHVLPYVLSSATVPVFVEAVSSAKILLAKPHLKNVFALKVNHDEALALTGVDVDNILTAQLCYNNLCDRVQNLYITNSQGVYVCTPNGASFVKGIKTEVVNTTGAGDSFFAGVVLGYMLGKDVTQCACYGQACSMITVKSPSAVSQQLSLQTIIKLAEEQP